MHQCGFAAAGAADDADGFAGHDGKADVRQARCTGALIGERDIIKSYGGSSRVFHMERRRARRIRHACLDIQHTGNALGAGQRLVQRDNQGCQFDDLDDDLQHVVVQCDYLSLRQAAEIDLNAGPLNQNNGCDVDEYIRQWIEQRRQPADKQI